MPTTTEVAAGAVLSAAAIAALPALNRYLEETRDQLATIEEEDDHVLPLGFYDTKTFRYMMGHKRGILVRTGARSDFKTQALEALMGFHTETAPVCRRARLTELNRLLDEWLRMYGGAPRKAAKAEYVYSLKASIEREITLEPLSEPVDISSWDVKPKTTVLWKQTPALLRAADTTYGFYDDITTQSTELEEAQLATGTVEAKVNSAEVKTQFERLGTALASVDLGEGLEIAADVIEAYIGLLELFDQLGISNLLNSMRAFKNWRITNERKKQMTNWLSDPSHPEGIHTLFINEFSLYGSAKLRSRQYSNIYLGITHFTRGISRIISLFSAATAAPVTEVINLGGLIAISAHEQARNLKGIYKAALGTKGVARKSHSGLLMYSASLDPSSTLFLKDYIGAQFFVGLDPLKAAKKKLWEEAWAAGPDQFREKLRTSMDSVNGSVDVFAFLRAARQARNPAELQSTLGEGAFALCIQSEIMTGLSSRPRYRGNAASDKLNEVILDYLIQAMRDFA